MKKHSINSSSISSLHALLSFVMWCLRRRPLLRVRRKTSSSTTTLSSAPLVRFNFPFCDMTKKKCYRILLVVDRNAIAASWGLRPMPFLSHTHERTMLACARHAITVAAAAAAVYASHKLYSLQSNVNSTILPEEIACIASRIIICSSHFFFHSLLFYSTVRSSSALVFAFVHTRELSLPALGSEVKACIRWVTRQQQHCPCAVVVVASTTHVLHRW